MNLLRAFVAFCVVALAVVLQVTLFPHVAWDGVVPNLALLVVVGAALVRGPQFAAVLGFVAGAVIDLAPPADHIAGRWALALVVVGYLSPITEAELDEAKAEHDTSVHGASVVGRAGLEKEYDKYLRGQPGYKRVAVDSMGRVLGEDSVDTGRPGDTLVTSLDARVQAVVEQQLEQTIRTARKTFDHVTGRNYVADSGAAVVMDARNGRIVAMAGQPTYDPSVWVGGITSKALARLYSEKAGTPLLFRATQGQFAPGSTWKPVMTAGALSHGYGTCLLYTSPSPRDS